jgi:hypothetical protein
MTMVRCGNSPGARARMADLDRAWVDWFAQSLVWSKADPATRGPVPVEPVPTDYDRAGAKLPAALPEGDTRAYL